MKCPHGDHELRIGDIPQLHMESYGKSCLVSTECCQRPVHCRPIFSFSAVAYTTDRKEDDWGNKFKRANAAATA